MPGSPESIPLGDGPPSRSQDQLTPRTTPRSESTVFSLSRSESLWTADQPGRGSSSSHACQTYWFPIHLMSTGGSILACGMLISGLFFSGHNRQVTIILGPALLSVGLMVLVVGVVLVPITRENRRPAMKRPFSYYRQPVFNL